MQEPRNELERQFYKQKEQNRIQKLPQEERILELIKIQQKSLKTNLNTCTDYECYCDKLLKLDKPQLPAITYNGSPVREFRGLYRLVSEDIASKNMSVPGFIEYLFQHIQKRKEECIKKCTTDSCGKEGGTQNCDSIGEMSRNIPLGHFINFCDSNLRGRTVLNGNPSQEIINLQWTKSKCFTLNLEQEHMVNFIFVYLLDNPNENVEYYLQKIMDLTNDKNMENMFNQLKTIRNSESRSKDTNDPLSKYQFTGHSLSLNSTNNPLSKHQFTGNSLPLNGINNPLLKLNGRGVNGRGVTLGGWRVSKIKTKKRKYKKRKSKSIKRKRL
jgi:hypothetical protein